MQRLLVAFMVFLTGICAGQDVAYDSKPNPHDLSAIGKAFENYSTDFRAMEQPLSHGDELQALEFLDQAAMMAEDRIFAANAELQMYDSITCGPDRLKVKSILKDQLAMYSWLFDKEITRTTVASLS